MYRACGKAQTELNRDITGSLFSPRLPAAIVSSHPIFSGSKGLRTRRSSRSFVRRATLFGGSVPVRYRHSASVVRDVSTTQALQTAPQLARSSTDRN